MVVKFRRFLILSGLVALLVASVCPIRDAFVMRSGWDNVDGFGGVVIALLGNAVWFVWSRYRHGVDEAELRQEGAGAAEPRASLLRVLLEESLVVAQLGCLLQAAAATMKTTADWWAMLAWAAAANVLALVDSIAYLRLQQPERRRRAKRWLMVNAVPIAGIAIGLVWRGLAGPAEFGKLVGRWAVFLFGACLFAELLFCLDRWRLVRLRRRSDVSRGA